MLELIKSISRKLLLNSRIRNYFCIIRVFYFCVIKKKFNNFNDVTKDTWQFTLDSNKRAVFDKDINLPKHPSRKKIFGIAKNLDGSKLNLLLEAIKKKYLNSEFKNLKILSIGPRSEGEIFNLFANGFELKNIVGIDLFSYSPFIKLGDMHNLEFADEEFDIALMGWCLAYSNNKQKVLSEVKRTLKKNGLLIIGHTVIEASDDEVLKKRGYLVASPFEKINSKTDLDNLVKDFGFETFYTNSVDRKIICGAIK